MPVIGSTVFALASALSYGASDFIGGRAATRLSTLTTLMLAQLAASGLAIAVASSVGMGPVSSSVLLLGGLGGLSHVIAVGLLYHGLAHGRVTVVAPISGVVNIVVPVLVDGVVLNGLSVLQGLGILLSGAAVCLVTRGTAEPGQKRADLKLNIGIGVASGMLFGLGDLSLGSVEANAAGDAVMAARLIGALGVLLVVLAVHRRTIAAFLTKWVVPVVIPAMHVQPVLPPASNRQVLTGVAMALVAGLFDCLGHLAYVMSATTGEISIAVATSALFPAVSVLLAIVILKESIGRLQSLGLGISVGAVVLLAGA